jgi:2-succinyl-5-enolpyruvyl-6-hydroxy-3-cyclohexene-1-carboxylate synthase
MNDLALTNANSLWGYFLSETLSRCGVKYAVTSPGSRSTPVVWALTHCGGIETIPVLDERGAAFFALGLAKQTGSPVVLSCTSGTAAANYFPAIIEAKESGVPLLVLTADRPPELWRCAAGQTVDQAKMYGANVLDYFELPVPEATRASLRQLRQSLCHAHKRTMLPVRGPVHVNCPLREPLAPESDKRLSLDFDPDELLNDIHTQGCSLPIPRLGNMTLPSKVRRGLIVAGTVCTDDDAMARGALWKLAERTGWPVVCDVLGPWRAGKADGVTRISAYDAILASVENRKRLAPDFVLQIGNMPTSKVLRKWLASLDLPTLVASTSEDNVDPLHSRAQSVQVAPEDISDILLPTSCSNAFAKKWSSLEERYRRKINIALDSRAEIFEGQVSREIFRALPSNARLFIANSMSVRHAESFAEIGHAPFQIFFNRGANGIDGTLATALGTSYGGRGVLLTGDLAFLYDAGSLAIAQHLRGSLTLVLIDNHGGGIFGKLPVAGLGDQAFEKFFATPQNVDFSKLAEAYGVDYSQVECIAKLRESLQTLPDSGVNILHVNTDRIRDMEFTNSLATLMKTA